MSEQLQRTFKHYSAKCPSNRNCLRTDNLQKELKAGFFQKVIDIGIVHSIIFSARYSTLVQFTFISVDAHLGCALTVPLSFQTQFQILTISKNPSKIQSQELERTRS